MLAKPVIYDGQLQRVMQQGDVSANEIKPGATDTTNTNLTITALMLLNRYVVRNPAGVSNENIDTAANLVLGFAAASSGGQVQNGTSFRARWINLSANALTLVATANTGLTLVRGAVAASAAKDFVITVTNGTPPAVFACTTTNASAVLGCTAAQAASVSVGMVVTNVVTGQQGQTIIGININGNSSTITLSGNANATTAAPGISFNFSPTVAIDGLSV